MQLLHLSNALSALDTLIPGSSAGSEYHRWGWWANHWGETWQRMLETKQIACGVTTRHVEDIAHMLDLLPSGLWHRAPHPSFVYFPVRSAGNSEMSFDRRRYVEHAHYLHLFLIQGTSGVTFVCIGCRRWTANEDAVAAHYVSSVPCIRTSYLVVAVESKHS